jgi:hypothetical protein
MKRDLVLHYRAIYIPIYVHTWTSALLRCLANTSFMVPFWPHTEPGSATIPVCEHLEATLVQRMLFIALMAIAQVSPNVFCSQGGFSQRTSEQYIIFRLHAHIHLCYRSHSTHLSTSHSCIAFTPSSFLHLFWSSWQAGCPWFLMSDTNRIQTCKNVQQCIPLFQSGSAVEPSPEASVPPKNSPECNISHLDNYFPLMILNILQLKEPNRFSVEVLYFSILIWEEMGVGAVLHTIFQEKRKEFFF